MDKYFRSFPRQRGGSSLWTDGSVTSEILNIEFFGANSYELSIDPGNYAITGTDFELLYNRSIDFQSGSYQITGSDIDLLYNRVLDVTPGVYAITGTDIELNRCYIFNFDQGSYTYTGQDIDFVYTPVTPPILSSGKKLKTTFVSNFVLK